MHTDRMNHAHSRGRHGRFEQPDRRRATGKTMQDPREAGTEGLLIGYEPEPCRDYWESILKRYNISFMNRCQCAINFCINPEPLGRTTNSRFVMSTRNRMTRRE